MELQSFFPADSRFLVCFGPNFLLQPVYGGFGVRNPGLGILCVIVQPPKSTFFFNKIQDGLTNR